MIDGLVQPALRGPFLHGEPLSPVASEDAPLEIAPGAR